MSSIGVVTYTVGVVSGRNLVGEGGGRNAFAEVHLLDSAGTKLLRKTTDVVKNTLNPSWNATLEFTSKENITGLSVNVWDHRIFSKNKHLGVVTIKFDKAIIGNTPITGWFTLQQRSSSEQVSGDVQLNVTCSYKPAVSPTVVTSTSSTTSTTSTSTSTTPVAPSVTSTPSTSTAPAATSATKPDTTPVAPSVASSTTPPATTGPDTTSATKPDTTQATPTPSTAASGTTASAATSIAPSTTGGATPDTTPTTVVTPSTTPSTAAATVTPPDKTTPLSAEIPKTTPSTPTTPPPTMTPTADPQITSTTPELTPSASAADNTPGKAGKPLQNYLKSSSQWSAKDGELKRSGFVVVDEDVVDEEEDDDPVAPTTSSTSWKAVLAEIIEINKATKDSLITGIEREDENVVITMKAPGVTEKESITLIIPEEYPRGEYYIMGPEGCEFLGVGSLKPIFSKVVTNFAKQHNVKPCPVFETETERSKMKESTLPGDDDAEDEFAAREGLAEAKAYVTSCLPFMPPRSGLTYSMISDTLYVRCSFSVDDFVDPNTATSWGLVSTKPIAIEFELEPPYYFQSTILPRVTEFQFDRNNGEISSFGLQWYLHNRLDKFLRDANWPPVASNKELFANVVRFCSDKVYTCTQRCQICDKLLDVEMLKPAVCDSALCVYSHMQYGLGEDVAAMILHHPLETDLLISLTCAAAAGTDTKRFNPFPSALEVKLSAEDAAPWISTSLASSSTASTTGASTASGSIVAMNFLTATGTNDASKVKTVIETIPPVSELQRYPDASSLKRFLDTKHPLAFILLRWILSSNLSHLELIPAAQQYAELKCPYQFMLLSAPPAKEKNFRELAKKHGSFFTFHGSAMYNWHSILRNGLKNYSNTEFMSCGAAYGAGIYMGVDFSTSQGYLRAGSAWSNSVFNGGNRSVSYNCMCLCEVINAGYKANPFYVVPEEKHVMTRMFMIYNSSMPFPQLQANSMKLKKASE